MGFRNLFDKNNTPIYIGDVIEAIVENDEKVQGVVIFAEELSSYVILCDEISKFYVLSTSVCDRIEVIGNVFDNPK